MNTALKMLSAWFTVALIAETMCFGIPNASAEIEFSFNLGPVSQDRIVEEFFSGFDRLMAQRKYGEAAQAARVYVAAHPDNPKVAISGRYYLAHALSAQAFFAPVHADGQALYREASAQFFEAQNLIGRQPVKDQEALYRSLRDKSIPLWRADALARQDDRQACAEGLTLARSLLEKSADPEIEWRAVGVILKHAATQRRDTDDLTSEMLTIADRHPNTRAGEFALYTVGQGHGRHRNNAKLSEIRKRMASEYPHGRYTKSLIEMPGPPTASSPPNVLSRRVDSGPASSSLDISDAEFRDPMNVARALKRQGGSDPSKQQRKEQIEILKRVVASKTADETFKRNAGLWMADLLFAFSDSELLSMVSAGSGDIADATRYLDKNLSTQSFPLATYHGPNLSRVRGHAILKQFDIAQEHTDSILDRTDDPRYSEWWYKTQIELFRIQGKNEADSNAWLKERAKESEKGKRALQIWNEHEHVEVPFSGDYR